MAQTQEPLWWAAGALYGHRWWVIGLTAIVAVAAVVLSLQVPNRFRAETRVLLPESGGLLAGVPSSLSSAAASLLGGGGGGDYTRYMAILTSRSTLASVVDRFDLVGVYDLTDEDFPEAQALDQLRERASFSVSHEFNYLAVSVLDESPERAAAMANFFVERLNERHIAFQTSSASKNRRFLEERLQRAHTELDSAQAELQVLQERSGVVEPTAQAQALFSALAAAQTEAAAAEVTYQTLRSQFGADNPDVRAARAGLDAARAQLGRLRSGSEAGLPSLGALPRTQRAYTEAMEQITLQRAVIETIQPLYEQSALQERREADAVQVLDPATPPVLKAEPRRSVIVIAATASGFVLALIFVLALAWLRTYAAPLAASLREAAERVAA